MEVFYRHNAEKIVPISVLFVFFFYQPRVIQNNYLTDSTMFTGCYIASEARDTAILEVISLISY